mmetsp:Transcript_7156/g.24334  ORF Transcript_7156/g.24334 Transcript_7156/m.24334 type:complete len:777 (-) Transcript_7156:235-2565(-)
MGCRGATFGRRRVPRGAARVAGRRGLLRGRSGAPRATDPTGVAACSHRRWALPRRNSRCFAQGAELILPLLTIDGCGQAAQTAGAARVGATRSRAGRGSVAPAQRKTTVLDAHIRPRRDRRPADHAGGGGDERARRAAVPAPEQEGAEREGHQRLQQGGEHREARRPGERQARGVRLRPRLRRQQQAERGLPGRRRARRPVGLRRLQQHGLRLRPDGLRQVLVHDRRPEQRVEPGPHPAHQHGHLRAHRVGNRRERVAPLPRAVLLLRDLQRDHLRSAGPAEPQGQGEVRRPPGQGAPRARHPRPGPPGARRGERGEDRGAHGSRREEPDRRVDADEQRIEPQPLRVPHHGPPEGHGERVEERLLEAEFGGPRGLRARGPHGRDGRAAQGGREHQQVAHDARVRHQRPRGAGPGQEGRLHPLPQLQAHARAPGVARRQRALHHARDAEPRARERQGDDVDAPLRRARQDHQEVGDEERGERPDRQAQRGGRAAQEDARGEGRRGRERRRRLRRRARQRRGVEGRAEHAQHPDHGDGGPHAPDLAGQAAGVAPARGRGREDAPGPQGRRAARRGRAAEAVPIVAPEGRRGAQRQGARPAVEVGRRRAGARRAQGPRRRAPVARRGVPRRARRGPAAAEGGGVREPGRVAVDEPGRLGDARGRDAVVVGRRGRRGARDQGRGRRDARAARPPAQRARQARPGRDAAARGREQPRGGGGTSIGGRRGRADAVERRRPEGGAQGREAAGARQARARPVRVEARRARRRHGAGAGGPRRRR